MWITFQRQANCLSLSYTLCGAAGRVGILQRCSARTCFPNLYAHSNPRGEPDRQARAGLDRGAQQLVSRGLFRAMFEAGVAMLKLLGAELLDRGLERGLVLAQRRGLGLVMLVDDLFDRDGAGHG